MSPLRTNAHGGARGSSNHRLPWRNALGDNAFGPTTSGGAHGRPSSAPPCPRRGLRVWGRRLRDTQADVPSARRLRAQLAFKDSMVRGILQFTPSIAFRCVLHRCESRDIRCRESFHLSKEDVASHTPRHAGAIPSHFKFLGACRAGVG